MRAKHADLNTYTMIYRSKHTLDASLYLTNFVVPNLNIYVADDIPRCKAGDAECLPRIITQIIRNNPKGHNGLAIPSLEPLRISRIDIKQGSGSAIPINLNFRDLELSGMSGITVTRVE